MNIGERLVKQVASLVGISLREGEISEITVRFESLLIEMEQLSGMDFSGIEPVPVFPEEGQQTSNNP